MSGGCQCNCADFLQFQTMSWLNRAAQLATKPGTNLKAVLAEFEDDGFEVIGSSTALVLPSDSERPSMTDL